MTPANGANTLVAEASSPRGHLLLRRSDDGHVELRVNGVYAVDTRETSSERALADLALAAAADPSRVVVGGLGLGCTLQQVLVDDRVDAATVVELEPVLVDWVRAGLVPGGAPALRDPRVDVRIGDVGAHVETLPPGSVDVIALDVDNGPDHLVHASNRLLYGPAFARSCAAALTTHGALAVWSMRPSTALASALAGAFAEVETHIRPVRLQARRETYCVLVAARPR